MYQMDISLQKDTGQSIQEWSKLHFLKAVCHKFH